MPDAPQSADGYTVVARRYRPQTFDELIGQQHVARALKQAITTGRVGHAYLFTGARGVGKTSAARILARALNCQQGPTPEPCNQCDACLSIIDGSDVDVMEMDGASNRGIDEIRQLRQNVAVRPSRSRFKVYLIDEVHMLTKEAFNALLKTLEEPPEHVKFIFATTDPQKLPITILSRCQRFDFAGVDSVAIQTRLAQIAEAEGVEIEPAALQILATRAAGSMRDSQSLLEQLLAVAGGKITADEVQSLLGIASTERISALADAIAARDAARALEELSGSLGGGADAGQLLDQLIGYLRDAMALAVGCPPERMLYALPGQEDSVRALGARLGVSGVLAVLQVLDQTAARMRVSLHGRTLVEMAIVRAASLDDLEDLSQLITDLRNQPPGEPGASAPGRGGRGGANPGVQTGAGRSPSGSVAGGNPESSSPRPPAAYADGSPAGGVGSGGLVGQLAQQVAMAAPITSPKPAAAPERPASPSASPSAAPRSLAEQFVAVASSAPAAPRPPKMSRRQLQAEALEHPYIKQAMETFGVEADGVRYTPPQEKAK
ncbi:DNA polymerase III subunit tau [Pirellulimonas nuda]|uniref:DNA polymerase III subunit gamma/tau n=1 Tax=Pirellulimonas nuda TaxID=2528009 RepID=A0A518DJC4_9BACT|nr:DNA polymerase III subunit gamma/tau [Pirellulimonas nuda]QDU91573.1 DNA polymerase III subunit tau [Pirellulimonas nuda]